MGAGSSPHSRNAKRDYWNSPKVITVCQGIDWTIAILGALALITLGSLNF